MVVSVSWGTQVTWCPLGVEGPCPPKAGAQSKGFGDSQQLSFGAASRKNAFSFLSLHKMLSLLFLSPSQQPELSSSLHGAGCE